MEILIPFPITLVLIMNDSYQSERTWLVKIPAPHYPELCKQVNPALLQSQPIGTPVKTPLFTVSNKKLQKTLLNLQTKLQATQRMRASAINLALPLISKSVFSLCNTHTTCSNHTLYQFPLLSGPSSKAQPPPQARCLGGQKNKLGQKKRNSCFNCRGN